MRRLLLILMAVLLTLFLPSHLCAQSTIEICGKVLDSKTRNELPGATVQLMSEDSTVIETKSAYSESWNDDIVMKYADYSFHVAKHDGAYIIKCSFAGYRTSYLDVRIENVGRRDKMRRLPPILLREEATMLGDVAVSATKVKFYYRGDTVVYNADAFVLSEGSMLDALVRQLPGVEIRKNGDIYHDGKLVESLLLNGKDFFKSDKSVMLDNLPTYTVKQIEVYDKQGERSEFLGRKIHDDKSYVMDVKLKKEYSIGFLANVEAGGGIAGGTYRGEDPYLGRIFAMRFTDHSRVAVFANANNLNDDRQPGQDNGWEPDNMKSGKTSRQMAGVDYRIDSRNKKWRLSGNGVFSHSIQKDNENTNRTNFLNSGDTYERMEKNIRNKNISVESLNEFRYNGSWAQLTLKHLLQYNKFDLQSGTESMAFADTVINKYISKGLSRGNNLYTELGARAVVKFSDATSDHIELKAGGSLSRTTDETFNRYSLFNGISEVAAKRSDQYFNNTPDRKHSLWAGAKYNYEIDDISALGLEYMVSVSKEKKGSRLYLLEKLDDYEDGEIGWLPSVNEYETVLDLGNSYSRTLDEVRNTLTPYYGLYKPTANGYWSAQIRMPLKFVHYNMKYLRGATDTIIRRNTLLPELNSTYVSWTSSDRSKNIDLRYWLNSYSPDLQYMVDIHDDTDPLNIREGNNGLTNSYRHRMALSGWIERNKKYRYSLSLSGSVTDNAIAMGYIYDVATGVRTYKAYNVDGNWDISLSHKFRMRQEQLTVEAEVAGTHLENADIVGSTLDGIVGKSTVRTERLDCNINGVYTMKKNSVSAFFKGWWRYMHSARESFTDMHVTNFNYGIRGVVALPLQMQLATGLTVYSRRGYNESSLNTNDLVWDARLSCPILKGRIVLMLDGFDILGNLKNVSYDVNGQGRTEVRRNMLQQYVLLHAQFKLNKQPKKKR